LISRAKEFDFESQFKRQLAGNIYLAKVTRVEPSLQAAFVDYGGNRHGFLAFSEIHPDYYQIPVADREALIAEEKAYAESLKAEAEAEAEGRDKPKPKRRRKSRAKAAEVSSDDAVATGDVAGMETIDLAEGEEGSSPMELVAETPVETPSADETADVPEAETADAAAEDAPVAEAEEAKAPDADADDDDAPKGKDATSKDDSIESVAEEDDSEDVRRAQATPKAVQDPGSCEGSPDPPDPGRERRARQQRCSPDNLPVISRSVLCADAKHRAWWRDFPQDHQCR